MTGMGTSKVVLGSNVLVDLTNDTVTAETLAEGITAHGADGEPIVGTLETGAYDVTSTDNGDGTQTLEIIDGGGSSGGFTPPAVGFVPSAWDADGYITDGTWYGNTIPKNAFREYERLTSISLPEGITTIGDSTFYNCLNLALTSLPEGITTIGSYTFNNCRKLTSISLPEGITTIGYEAFSYCIELTTLTFEGKPRSIDSTAFSR